MRHLAFFIPVLLVSCTPENDQEVLDRAINDEAMQLINLHFENGNEELYAEVEKCQAALQATKGKMPDYTNFYTLDSLFSQCKQFLDDQQEDFTAAYCWPPFDPGEPDATSCVKKLRLEVDFDLSILKNEILETISLAKEINSGDTIYRVFSNLHANEFKQVRNYSYHSYSTEIDSVVSGFENAYLISSGEFEVIDVLEFFTLCRSTLLVAERKTMRFHTETLLPRSRIEIGSIINTIVPDKTSYFPGEKFEFAIHPLIMCNESFSRVEWQIDSGTIHKTVFRQDYCMDTIVLPTQVAGRHRVDITYLSLDSRFDAFQKTFFYTVVEP